MLSKFLALLAWAGLYRVGLEILNAGAPLPRGSVSPPDAVDLTSRLMQQLVDGWVSQDGRQVAYAALEQSPFYTRDFQEFRSLLKAMDPARMQEVERKTFFINLYNLLTIDAILSMDSLPRSTLSVTQFWRRYGYQVGPYTLHLDDIEHGILRGNRAHPTSGDVMFASDDPRRVLTLPADHRIHSVLNCGAASCPPLASYFASDLDRKLDTSMANLCRDGVTSINKSTIIINSIFEWFRSDFGATEQDALRFLATCSEDPARSSALNAAADGRRRYTYYYDWSLNNGTVANRVKVSVYFESLCSDSIKFFKNQLYPVWQDLQDIMDLEFIPFGKARATPTETGDYEFQCQHGPDECYGNRVMSCAQNSLPIGTQVEFFQCMMTKRYPAFFGKQCSEEVGIAWAPLQECAKSVRGAVMLYQNGVRTASLKPQVHFIPTITINGRYDNRRLRVSLMALRSQICASYDGPPHQNCL
ncbi:uncharacterized protein LOC119572288 [Penaeus monodon]|uniref:uncharacterized protein LOC119572288 n=1 Tax=Penaeus monodon TaxID=6687 RepID=UPI0018A6E008|nr:uncharacterized protein LOC119572288 [Penaeus monodon]